jgi:hypothetical protein
MVYGLIWFSWYHWEQVVLVLDWSLLAFSMVFHVIQFLQWKLVVLVLDWSACVVLYSLGGCVCDICRAI